MNLPEQNPNDGSDPTDDSTFAQEGQELYCGDRGHLTLETRRALVQLLSGPSLDAKRHARLWPILVRDEAILRSRLSDLFLDLVIDLEQRVAFTRQADVRDLETPTLLRRAPLTFVDSLVLLLLRST